MPLVPCPACNASVSDEAVSCPRCGHPLTDAPHPSPRGSAGNVVAAVASLIIPGAGQVAQGRVARGIVHFVLAVALWFVFAGWVVHLVSAYNAGTWTGTERTRREGFTASLVRIAIAVAVVVVLLIILLWGSGS